MLGSPNQVWRLSLEQLAHEATAGSNPAPSELLPNQNCPCL